SFSDASENLAGDLGQQSVGQNVVNVAGAALYFGAASGNGSDQRVVVFKFHLVVLEKTLFDFVELEDNDAFERFVLDRKIRNNQQASEKCRLENLVQFRFERLHQACGTGMGSGSAPRFINVLVQAIVVRRVMVFLKSISRPSPSSINPL